LAISRSSAKLSSKTSFEIRESTGTANIKVSYRIVAKSKDCQEDLGEIAGVAGVCFSRRRLETTEDGR